MRFLLIAPLAAAATVQQEKQGSRERGRFDADRLHQSWVDLDAAAQPIPATATSSAARTDRAEAELAGRVRRAALCSSRGGTVLVLEVELEGRFPTGQAGVHQRERLLDATADEFAARNSALGTPRWVARVALPGRGATLGAAWVGKHRAPGEVTLNHSRCTVQIGWGNSEIRGRSALTPGAWREVVRGLVDAQVLWTEITSIGDRAAEATDTMLLADPSGRKLASYQAVLSQLLTDVALHNLAHDELLTNMQGERQIVSSLALQVWGYDEVTARVARRLADLDDVARRRESARSGRYQRLVEGVLLVLALVTVIDLAFAVVGTAYSGGVSAVPGEGSWLHLFDGLRAVNADVFVAAGMLVLIGIVLMLTIGRRRR